MESPSTEIFRQKEFRKFMHPKRVVVKGSYQHKKIRVVLYSFKILSLSFHYGKSLHIHIMENIFKLCKKLIMDINEFTKLNPAYLHFRGT